MAHEFGFDVAREADDTVIWIRGEVDLHHGDELAGAIIERLREQKVVIVDLTDVTFIDSAGLSAFIQSRREADRLGREFRVRSASGMVADLLRLTGLSEWLAGEPQ